MRRRLVAFPGAGTRGEQIFDADTPTLTRRTLLSSLAAAGAASALRPLPRSGARPDAHPADPIDRRAPSPRRTRQLDHVQRRRRSDRARRLRRGDSAFFQDGGRLIDSSPMYGSSQDVIGYGVRKLGSAAALCGRQGLDLLGRARTRADRGVPPALGSSPLRPSPGPQPDAWEEHLPTLFAMKKAGRVRYVGVTTSEGAGTTRWSAS